jgi:carbonic anhydrase
MIDFPTRLIDGYRSFRAERLPADAVRYRALAERGQSPEIMVIACCDSRSAPETIFDAAPGELFVHRNVANLIPPYDPDGTYHGTSAAIEFAVAELKVRHVVVMGHGRCGGVAAFLAGAPAGGDFIGKWISIMAPAAEFLAEDTRDAAARQQALEFASVRRSIDNLGTFPFVRTRAAERAVALHGAWFDIATGALMVLDQATGRFAAAAVGSG